MKFKAILTIVTLSLLFATPALAQDTTPVDDITTDFEALPGLFGMGAVVALVVMVARLAGVPDGLGGKAALLVGIFIYIASELLPVDQRDKLFEAMNYLAEFLVVVVGSYVTHAGSKRLGMSWWKQRDETRG